ncbi:hypothetical protein Leryth_019534 [Lithospermum erythrorhizon]|nr:hypothetical protein Leryth_019534 [Lithospermum erythrorhizon]
MASTSSISNLDTDSNNLSPKKRRKLDNMRWKNSTEQQIYTTKLVQSCCSETGPSSSCYISKGKYLSRAILTSRVSSRLCQINALHKRAKPRKSKCQTITRHSKLKKSTEEMDLEKKVKLLGSLIPGCRKVSFPNLLEESRDYIAALQMQVRAMSVLTQLLTSGATSSSSSSCSLDKYFRSKSVPDPLSFLDVRVLFNVACYK